MNNIFLYYTLSHYSYLLKYSNDGELISNSSIGGIVNKIYFNNFHEYIAIINDNYFVYYSNNILVNETKIKYYHNDFILLNDNSLVLLSAARGAFIFYRYEYPPFKLIQKVQYYSRDSYNPKIAYIKLIECSDKFCVFFSTGANIHMKIFDQNFNFITSRFLFPGEIFYINNLEEEKTKIILCTKDYNEFFCYYIKYDDEIIIKQKIFIGHIFSNFDIKLYEKNKFALTRGASEASIYFSTIKFEDDFLKIDLFHNLIIFPNREEYLGDLSIYYEGNNNFSVYTIEGKHLTKVYNIKIFEYCKSFSVNYMIPLSKQLITFENYIRNESKYSQFYIHANYGHITIFKNDTEQNFLPNFTIYDKIYIKNKEISDKPFNIFYVAGYGMCKISVNTKNFYIKVNETQHECLLNPTLSEINNIIALNFEQKLLENSFTNNEMYLNIEYEKEIRNIDTNFYYLNGQLDCKKNGIKNLQCKIITPKDTKKVFRSENYVCSKLSCRNNINIVNLLIRDKYLLNVYQANNITTITSKINTLYDPKEKIENFSVDMISYYLWFSSFGYCDDDVIASGKCCKNQILKNWKLIAHKEYNKKYKNSENYNNNFDLFKDTSEKNYFYNFAILKSDKYKKYVFCFPGTTSFIQLLDEIKNSDLTKFAEADNDIKVERYFYSVFLAIHKDVFSEYIINDLKSNQDYQIIFTGHSLGGALSTLISYYYKKNELSKNEPILITFGQPRVGNVHFAKDYMKLIPKVFRIARESDPVTKIPFDKKYNINSVKLLSELITESINNKKNDIFQDIDINKSLKKTLIIKSISNMKLTYGYCHIGGLYILIDKTFYQCADFFDEETNHIICRNLGLDHKFSFDFKNHGYLNAGEEVMKKCQKDKKFSLRLF